jgi:hypothetical protein
MTMPVESQQYVPKVHPATRAVEADDPMTLTATTVPGDPEEMLRCIIQEYAWMGWTLDQLMCLFRDPFFPALFGLWQLYGEAGLRERAAAILGQTGVFQFQAAVVEALEWDEEDDEEPELIQLGWRSHAPETVKGDPHAAGL